MANPGPASLVTTQSVAVVTPVNTPSNPTPQGTNALRLLAVARAVSLSATGDAAAVAVINAGTYAVTNVVAANSSGNVATGQISVNTGAAVTGTSIVAVAALTTHTASNVVSQRTVVAGTLLVSLTAQTIYVNVGVAVAGTIDLFIYGYDLT